MGSSFTKAIAPSAPAFTSPLVFSLITTIRQAVSTAREAQGPRRALLVGTKEVQPIMQVLDKIELHHLGIAAPVHRYIHPPARSAGEIHYLCVIEEEDFHVGVFVLPPRARIPLHDHPGMCVLSRLLCGSLNVKDFDWCDAPPPKEDSTATTRTNKGSQQPPLPRGDSADTSLSSSSSSSSSSSAAAASSSSPRFRRMRGLAVLRSLAWVTRPSTLSLFNECNNIHEFEAGEEGCAILDVLIPPYDPMQGRPCNYYRATPYESPSLPSTGEEPASAAASSSASNNKKRKGKGKKKQEAAEQDEGDGSRCRLEVGRVYRLSATEAPVEFDVISAVYRGPPPSSSVNGVGEGDGGGGRGGGGGGTRGGGVVGR